MDFQTYFSEFPSFCLMKSNLRKIESSDAGHLYAYYNNIKVHQEQLLKKQGFEYEGLLRQYEEHYVTKEVKDMKLFAKILAV